ncbi:ABC transporter permease [Halosegnis rubeus]|uniref:ABC transporter permease subunit n=1 Tax=Halosegnis rubeus TaxID=2212850 RepID=A0A5N5UA39_9EURY|nr:iron ABC transporter permease [Halosegnis rubeus]KAB7515464.1 ABC transporter permease subunit [Halosegnis rubeus]KAB7517772.1 ABC transporter permease subunit [Halosegnis rubeus]
MFYYPVGSVLAEAVTDGGVTLAPIRGVLADDFYTGALADAIRSPASIPAGLAGWLLASASDIASALAGLVGTLVSPFETGLRSWPGAVLAGVGGVLGALAGVVPGFGLFGFTAWQALLSTVASLALGLPGAYVLARFEFPGRRTLESLTAVPFVLPSIMVAVGFVAAFGVNGPLNRALAALGLPTVELLFSLEIIIIAHAFYNAPLVTRIVAAAWESVDARAVETARSLGASPARAFRDVVVPQLLPAVATGALLTFIFTFMSFPIVLALGGLEYATVEVWLYNRVGQLDIQEAAVLAVLETVVSLGLTYAYLRYEAATSRGDRVSSPLDRDPLVRFDAKRVALAGYGVVVAGVFLLPIVSMLAASVTSPEGLTLRYYRFLLERGAEATSAQVSPTLAVRNSLLFGAGTLLLAVPMGVLLALASTREGRLARAVGVLSMAPFAVSGVVVGLGLLQTLVFGTTVLGHRIVVGGPLAIVAAHAVGAYPFVVRNVAPLLAGLDRRLVESARALGATRNRALLDIELPLVAPGIAAGAAFAFAISIGEFDSTVLLASASGSDTSLYTMPVAVERFLGKQTLGRPTAMGSVLLAVTAGAFIVIDRVGGRYRE